MEDTIDPAWLIRITKVSDIAPGQRRLYYSILAHKRPGIISEGSFVLNKNRPPTDRIRIANKKEAAEYMFAPGVYRTKM